MEDAGTDGNPTTDGSTPITMARQLTGTSSDDTYAGDEWNDANSDTLGAWNFGTSSDVPKLRYADYDGSGTDFNCDMFPVACGTELPGQ